MVSLTSFSGRLRRAGTTALLSAVVVGLYFGYVAYQNRKAIAATGAAFKKVEKTHVYALGRLEPAGTLLQLAPKSGNEGTIVEELLVREGDDVVQGQTLAVLDNHTRKLAALSEAESRKNASEARLQQVLAGSKKGDLEAQEAALKLLDEQIKVAERDLRRATELAEKKAIASELLDQRQWDVLRFEIERRRAAGMLDSLKEVRDVDVKVAQMDVEAANATVARARADLDASVLKASADGRILRIHTHPGERISDKGILELGNVTRMQAVAEVFEADVPLLQVGMVTSIRVDASGNELSGKVAEIGQLVARKIVLTNDPVSDTDARVIEVRIDLNADDIPRVERLSNSRVEVRISLHSEEKSSERRTSDPIRTAEGD